MKTILKVPTLPNFLTVVIPGGAELAKISIGDIREDDLRELGKRWTEELVAHAKAKRAAAAGAKPGA